MEKDKVIGGMPTRNRTGAVNVARKLLPTAEHVFITARECELESDDPRIEIVPVGLNIELGDSRNILLALAQAERAEFLVQSDDDLSFKPDLVEEMVRLIKSEPYMGAVSTLASKHFWYTMGDKPNKGWVPKPSPSALYVLRLSAIQEVGGYRYNTFEDIDLGLRLWSAGWVVAQVHTTQAQTYQHMKGRVVKTAEDGGQPPEERDAYLREVVPEIAAEFTGTMLKSLRLADPGSNRTYHVRYNWAEMFNRSRERWGTIGYRDARGREF